MLTRQRRSLSAIFAPSALVTSYLLVAWLLAACLFAPVGQAAESEGEEFFETHIRPVLVEHCYSCHSVAAGKTQGGLLLDSRQSIRDGGDTGPAVVPRDVDASLILDALRYESVEMPPQGKLDDAVIARFEQWIRAGAADPREPPAPPADGADQVAQAREGGEDHWAFQPLRATDPPETHSDWPRDEIDAFVLAGLDSAGLQPTEPATRSGWLRRVTFDLTGLPPSPSEIAAFLADERVDAYERVVDRLLASPAYGERYGRHWLDLARYADSNGADENHAYPVAWRYRDYVVEAMNADLPYDQFVTEQLAGDLLRADSEAERSRLLTATGFLVLGPKMLAEQDKPKLVADLVDEQLDTVGKVFLGLTIGCARCHDHKFDPIAATDYYALAGIFHSTRTMEHLEFVSQWNERELPDAEMSARIAAHQQRIDAAAEELKALEAELSGKLATPLKEGEDLAAVIAEEDKPRLTAAREKVEGLRKSLPALEKAMAADEAPLKIVPVHVRGSHLQMAGEPLERQVPQVLQAATGPVQFPTDQSGRLEFARWLAHPANPLTARVMANRLWQYHFGEGLVRSSSNFGLRGEAPTHPELLDDLAQDFMAQGWSQKTLHRRIVLSATYRMGSAGNPQGLLVDPDNRWLWRMNRHRLEVEPIRDSLLCVAGEIDLQIGGQAEAIYGSQFPDSKEPRVLHDAARRTLYLPINRAALEEFYATFDYVDPAVSLEKRPVTTVPHQALYLMNHRLALYAGWQLAHRAERHSEDPDQRLEYIYAVCFARQPTAAELDLCRAFLQRTGGDQAWVQLCRSLLLANEFIYVD